MWTWGLRGLMRTWYLTQTYADLGSARTYADTYDAIKIFRER